MKKIVLFSASLTSIYSCVDDAKIQGSDSAQSDKVEVSEIPDDLNILYIMTDQQNYNMMSWLAGNEYISTPNLDKLAAEGYAFNNNYCNNPVSMPSRFSLLTGLPASRIGVRGNNSNYDEATRVELIKSNSLGNIFSAAGFETVYVGKTHFYGDDNNEFGFDIKSTNSYDTGCAVAVEYLKSRSASDEKPFFMFVSFMNPHDICYSAGLDSRYPDELSASAVAATQYYLDYKLTLSDEQYQSQIPPPLPNEAYLITDPNDADMPDPTQLKSSGLDYAGSWTTDEQELFRWMYCRLTESVDALIGNVIDALEQSGVKDKTLIIFTSDHGELLGAHGYTTKSLLFAEAQRVPFIFAGPGVQVGVVDNETLTCNGLDLMPTLCDFAGVEPPQGLTGISLKALLGGDIENQPERTYIVTEASNSFQITDGVNKLTMYEFEGLPRVFSNLDEDPYETINMLKYNRYASTIDIMQAELDKYISDNNITLEY